MARLVRTTQLSGLPIRRLEPQRLRDADGRPLLIVVDEERLQRVLDGIAGVAAPKTVSTYATYVRAWWSLCERLECPFDDLPTLRGWLDAMSRGHHAWGPSTLRVAMAAVTAAWGAIGVAAPLADWPTRQWFGGSLLRRVAAPPARKAPVLRQLLQTAIAQTEELISSQRPAERLTGLRDRALLLLGWCGALRRSELAAVQVAHLQRLADGGWALLIPKSKTDRARQGQLVPFYPSRQKRLDPILAVQAWCQAAGIAQGPVFRRISRHGGVGTKAIDPSTVRLVLKRYCLDDDVSAHSLRSGFVTQARLDDVATHRIKMVTRHRTDHMIDVYTRAIDIRRQGPGTLV